MSRKKHLRESRLSVDNDTITASASLAERSVILTAVVLLKKMKKYDIGQRAQSRPGGGRRLPKACFL